MVTCSTTGSRDDLPEVLSPLPWLTCPAVRVGRAISEGETYFLDQEGLTDCADAQLNACGRGSVRYRLRISRQGVLQELTFQEPRVAAVETCVAERLRAAIFMP